jgi:hypothetical protein
MNTHAGTPRRGGVPLAHIRAWLTVHDVTKHALVPLWARLPDQWRARILGVLDRSDRFCPVVLADAYVVPADGEDPCDGHLPLPGGLTGGSTRDCRATCQREHDRNNPDRCICTCYCGWAAITGGGGR